MRKTFCLGLLAASVFAASFFVAKVYAQPHPGGGEPGPRCGLPLEALDLSSSQQVGVDAIMDTYHPQIRSAERALHAAHEALDKLVSAGSSDESAIRAAADDLGGEIGDLSLIQAKISEEVRTLLTSDQLAQLEQMESHKKSGFHPPPPR
jgi:Spy/CpxP family protein refolding chaperone